MVYKLNSPLTGAAVLFSGWAVLVWLLSERLQSTVPPEQDMCDELFKSRLGRVTFPRY